MCSSAFAEKSYKLDLPDTIFIELNPNQYNKYARNRLRILVDGDGRKIYQNILSKYKNWYYGKISSSNDDNYFNAKLRITGDWKDHINVNFTSLYIRINDGSISGIRDFKLLLPHTRNNSNDILWNSLMNYYGLKTLKSKIVKVSLNKKIYRAIFFEMPRKEYLEENNIRETVLLEFDERLMVENYHKDHVSSKDDVRELLANFNNQTGIGLDFAFGLKVINKNFVDSSIANKISSDAIFLLTAQNWEDYITEYDFYQKSNFIYANHGLNLNNRVLYYTPFNQNFNEVYREGNVTLDADGKIKKCDTSNFSKEEIQHIENFIKKYEFNFRVNDRMKCLIVHLNKIYLNSKKDYPINNINISPIINEKKQRIINQIIKKIELNSSKNNDNLNITPIYNFILTLLYKSLPYECNYNTENNEIDFCKQISTEKYSNYLIGKVKPIKYRNLKIYGINLGTIDYKNNFEILNVNNKKHNLNNPLTYLFNLDNVKKENLQSFIFENDQARLILYGTFRKEFNFHFLNESYLKNNMSFNSEILEERFNNHLITGCVTFYKTNFQGGKISSKDMKCEDSVNIMNSNGTINNIEVFNSGFDAIDADFSNILFEKIKIVNSKNDCLDLSKGSYDINVISTYNCGDKGLSAGEKSKVVINNFEINKYNIGIASKDGSDVKINIANISNRIENKNNMCLAAYRKKINYIGGTIEVEKLKCDSEVYVSSFSEDLYKACVLRSKNNKKLFCDRNNFVDNYSSINVKTRN